MSFHSNSLDPTCQEIAGLAFRPPSHRRLIGPFSPASKRRCRGVEQRRLHLPVQRSIHIFDLNATRHEAFAGLKSQTVLLMLGNSEIKRARLPRFQCCQGFLDTLDFGWI